MKHRYLISLLILTALGVVIFWFSYVMVWSCDDIYYQYDFTDGSPIRSIGQVFASQVHHWATVNGRFVAHVLCQIFLPLAGQTAFAVCNALVYPLMVMLLLCFSGMRESSPWATLFVTSVLLVCCDVVYTPPCQIGYVWMSAVSLVFIRIFLLYAVGTSRIGGIGWIGLFLLGLVAGNGNETFCVGIGGALIIYFLMHPKTMTRRQWALALGFGVGGLFLCLSPGSLRRAGLHIDLLVSVMRFFAFSRVLYLMLAVLAYRLIRRQITLRRFYDENSFVVNALIVTVIFNLMIGITSETRQIYGVDLFSMLLVVRMVGRGGLNRSMVVLLAVAVALIYVFKYTEIRRFNHAYMDYVQQISECRDSCVYLDYPVFSNVFHPTNGHLFYYNCALSLGVAALSDIDGNMPVPYTSPDRDYEPRVNRKPLVEVYPTAVRDILSDSVASRVVKYDDGRYLLARPVGSADRFMLHRRLDIFGITIPYRTVEICFDGKLPPLGSYEFVFSDFWMPFVENTEVEILKP